MKKKLFKILYALFAFFILMNQTKAQKMSRLHTSGQQILDEAGNPVLLRGINTGGWLLQEGYIVSPSGGGAGAGTQGDMKRKLYGLGYTDAQVEDFYQKWRDNYITKADVDYIASQGFNCIRMPLHYELFLSASQRAVRNNVVRSNNNTSNLNAYIDSLSKWYNNNQLFANPANLEGIKAIDRLLGWCAANKMYVIVDLHAAPGGQGSDANIADPLLPNDLWNRTYNGTKIYQDMVVRLWQTIAAHTKDSNTVAMYDLINEPNNVPGGAATLFSVLDRTINAIRALGDNHMLLIEGDGWGNEFGNSIKPANFTNNSNLVYNSHRYGDPYVGPAVDYITDAFPTNTNKIGNQVVFRNQNNVPTWVGETGENSPAWITADVDRIVGENVGYAYWTYKRFNNNASNTLRNIPGPFLTDANPDLNMIINNLQFANSIENPSQVQAVAPNYKAQRKGAPYGTSIWIKGNNNQYLSSQSASNIRCNKTTLGDYEKFTLVDAGNGMVALKSFNNTYVSCENGLKPITSTRSTFSGWESFEWWEFKDGGIALRGFNKKFISSENGLDSMHCTRESANMNSWEKFTWGLVVPVAAPVITSANSATANVGTVFNYTITATNNPTSFGSGALPAGLNLNTSSGLISGTPTTSGTYMVNISANNAGGVSGSAILTLTIGPVINKSNLKVIAYVPNWIDLNIFSAGIDYSKLTHINIAFENPINAAGDLSYNTPNDVLIAKAHANNLKILMSIGGGSASTDPTLQARYFSLISATNRAGFVSRIAAYLTAHNLDGLDVDLEGPAINADYGAFIQDLAAALKPAGKLLSAAVSQGYGGANIPNTVFQYMDYMNIMAYDATGPWDPTNPGQHSSYAYAQSNTQYWLGRGLPRFKAVLGVPFYGYGFGTDFSNNTYDYKGIVASHAGAEFLDQTGNTIWYNGIPTIKAKTNYALSEGIAGIMIWSLDNDAPGAKSLLTAINEAVLASMVPGPYNTIAIIPGKIEAENFDKGGEGSAYHDADPINNGGQYRYAEGVDIEACTDAGAGFDVGWTVTGEWLKYTVNVQTAGNYTLDIRVAAGAAGTKTLHVELDGVNISGPVSFTTSTGWQAFQTISVTTPLLTAGKKTMRIVIDAGGFNLNYVNFSGPVVVTSTPPAEIFSAVTLYPNPVKQGGNLALEFSNQDEGKYRIHLLNNLGQAIFQAGINVSGGAFVYSLELPQPLASGYYQMEIVNASGYRKILKIVIQ